ncbi:hypothetical protein [Silvanigrella aquatica]|uniref:LysM domain-containing protein n=1 Tax=Silvanigrella aquatica TaxID=1915309 RepID=A0A1L4D0N5_9BACT|nr:hypothetical protein [Silvanigrella aquatica]APJ03765.1 hypothetical protein AXG55_07540 [Silvanigrella aquatica]
MVLKNQNTTKNILVTLALTMVTLFANNSFANENYIEYKVQKNDTITTILKTHSLRPIYGKDGSLEEVLKINPHTKETNGDLIYVGEILRLPNDFNKPGDKPQQANVKREKQKIDLTPKNNPSVQMPSPKQTQKSPIQKPEPKKQPEPAFKPEPKKQPEPAFKPEPKKQPEPAFKPEPKKQPEPAFKPEPKKEIVKTDLKQEQKAVIPKVEPQPTYKDNKIENAKNENKSGTEDVFSPNKSDVTFKPKQDSSKSKVDNEFLTYSKTQLPSLPLKTINPNSDNDAEKFHYEIMSKEYDFNLEKDNYCNPAPSCRIWLWEPESRCCKPNKKYFLIYEKNSL